MKYFTLLIALLLLVGCNKDETAAAFAAMERVFLLEEIDGQPFPSRATLQFPEPGRVAGSAPCNSYSGPITVPYPWFELGPLAVTRRACPELADEAAFLRALQSMTLAEASGDILILSNTEDGKMVFRAQD